MPPLSPPPPPPPPPPPLERKERAKTHKKTDSEKDETSTAKGKEKRRLRPKAQEPHVRVDEVIRRRRRRRRRGGSRVRVSAKVEEYFMRENRLIREERSRGLRFEQKWMSNHFSKTHTKESEWRYLHSTPPAPTHSLDDAAEFTTKKGHLWPHLLLCFACHRRKKCTVRVPC